MSGHHCNEQHNQQNSHFYCNGPAWNYSNQTQVPPEAMKNGVKRSRDSPTDHAWQQSFKRLKVVDSDLDLKPAASHNGIQSFSLDEASLADETITSNSMMYPQHSSFSVQDQHGFIQQPQNHHRQQQQAADCHSAKPYSEYQTAGQHSSEIPHESAHPLNSCGPSETPHAIDYHPMNSLLGNLHMMRRRQRSGTGQGADPVPCGEERPGMALVQQGCHHQQRNTSNPNNGGIGSSFLRPAKKKNISLRVDSNLF